MGPREKELNKAIRDLRRDLKDLTDQGVSGTFEVHIRGNGTISITSNDWERLTRWKEMKRRIKIARKASQLNDGML